MPESTNIPDLGLIEPIMFGTFILIILAGLICHFKKEKKLEDSIILEEGLPLTEMIRDLCFYCTERKTHTGCEAIYVNKSHDSEDNCGYCGHRIDHENCAPEDTREKTKGWRRFVKFWTWY
jgi:hypothetical protein